MTTVVAADSGIDLTRKGEQYVAHLGGRAPIPRLRIERRINRHLALVTALLAILDRQDGDPDFELEFDDDNLEDLEQEDDKGVDDDPCDEHDDYPKGEVALTASIFSGGSGAL